MKRTLFQLGLNWKGVRSSLTPLGKIFLLLMAVFYLAATTSQSGLLLLLIGLFAAALISNLIVSRSTVSALALEAPEETMIKVGETLKEPWKLHNKGQGTAQLLELHSPAGRFMRTAQIQTQEFIARVPPLQFTKRGIFPNAEITVSSTAPFGLWQSSKATGLKGRTIVYPKLYQVESPPASSLDRMSGGKMSGSQRVTSGMNFSGVREWQAGDPFRNIHWKSTATQGKLMVKLFEEELSGRIGIFLELPEKEGESLENAITAAGSLAMAALEEGHQVEFGESSSLETLVLAPFSDAQELLLRLAAVGPVRSGRVEGEKVVERFSRKAAVCVVLPMLGQEQLRLIERVAESGRKVMVAVPAGVQVPGDTPARAAWFTAEGIQFAQGK